MRQLLRTYAKDLDCKSGPHQHYQQLTEIIRKRAKDNACATLFAKPIENVHDGSIDWYTDLEGDIIRLNEATEEQAALFWNKYDIIDEKLDKVSQALYSIPRKSTQDNAIRLDRMRTYPGSIDYLFLVGQEPVIAAWGCGSAPIIPPPEQLAKKTIPPTVSSLSEPLISEPRITQENSEPKENVEEPSQEPAEPPPPEEEQQEDVPAEPKRRSWIWWVLSAILFIIICILLFARCSNQKIIPIETDKEKVDEMALQADELRKDIDSLKDRLTTEWSDCPGCQSQDESENQNLDTDSVQRRIEEYVPDLAPSKVSISLIWNTYHDLDLHVFSPKGDHICFLKKKRSDRYGGRLNIDFNNRRDRRSFSRRPLENITWPQNGAPSGVYTVKIMLYSMDRRDAGVNPVPYLVLIDVNGKVKEFKGSVPFHQKGKYKTIHKFRVD